MSVRLLGLGSVGSPCAIELIKMGIPLTLQDTDKVELHNVTNQFMFQENHIGKSKLDVVADACKAHNSAIKVLKLNSWFRAGDSIEEDIVISAVDTMAVRQLIYDCAVVGGKTRFLLDPRLGGEYIRIHCVDLFNKESRLAYLDELYDDSQTTSAQCSGASIIYTPTIAASFLAKFIKNILNEQWIPETLLIDMSSEITMNIVGAHIETMEKKD